MALDEQPVAAPVAQAAIEAIRRGDDPAAEAWLAEVRRELARLAADMLRDRDEAEDVAQAALLNFVSYLRGVPVPVRNPLGLAATIARNLCIGRLRCRSRRGAPLSLQDLVLEDGTPVELASAAPAPDRWFEREEEERLLREAVHGLQPKYQRVLRGLYWDGQTKETVARGLRVSVRTAHNLRERALALLTRRIRRIGIADSPAGGVRKGERCGRRGRGDPRAGRGDHED